MSGCLCSIVPPNVLEQVARTGSAADRESALNTLAIDHSLRTLRIENGTLRGLAARRLALAHGGGGAPLRVIYDAQHRTDTHASLVMRTEGESSVGDTAANEAFDGLGHTYRLYWDAFQRDSIDDGGMPLLGEVHFGVDYDNAFWDGARMMFGDGDGRLHRLYGSHRRDRTRADPRGHPGHPRPSLHRSVGSPERVHLRRLRITREAVRSESDG